MAQSITNMATLTYEFGDSSATATSNIASTKLEGPLKIKKTSHEESYHEGEELTYLIYLKNTGSTSLPNAKITDDLGTYDITDTKSVTPLSYLGPTKRYTNDVYTATITPTYTPPYGDTLEFNLGTIAAGDTVVIMYKVKVNQYANLTKAWEIVNTVKVEADGVNDMEDTHAIRVAEYARVEIEKSMEPNPVMDGSKLTYNFVISNYGNEKATSLILKDAFDKDNTPSELEITIDGTVYEEADYEQGVLLIPGVDSSYEFEIDPATIEQDEETGVVTVTPKKKKVVVVGTI